MMISRMNSTLENISTKQNSVKDNGNLQTKLMAEQRRLKAVDSDANMNESEKAKEKLKIQQQIDDLNRKLKMEELEKEQKGTGETVAVKEADSKEQKDTKGALAKEDKIEAFEKKQEAVERKASSQKEEKVQEKEKAEDVKNAKEDKGIEQEEKEKKTKEEKIGVSPQEVHKMLSLDYELQKERVLNQVSDKKEGSEDVLRAEIKSDKIQGTDIEGKEEKLVEMREKKPIQIEVIEANKKESLLKPEDGMKIVIK